MTKEEEEKYGNRLAPKGKVYMCLACGKESVDLYGDIKADDGFDESCMLNCALVEDTSGRNS